jgi:hypothetical protein
MLHRSCRFDGGLGAAALTVTALATCPAHAASQFTFAMVGTAGLPATYAPNARTPVKVEDRFEAKLTLAVRGFGKGAALLLFVIQQPNFPFGLGWYTGDVPIGEAGGVVGSLMAFRDAP